ncbi:MAG: O-methyltransferase [Actinomycetota bacterium]|nr:O-methyltransferase [Actinomycetota bacterium]
MSDLDLPGAAVDSYLEQTLLPADPVLEAALASSASAGLPAIQVSALQGALLMLLARTSGATRVLEIGTLGGYSTIWLARGLGSGGRVVTLEADPVHAEVARSNLARAGLAEVTEVVLGAALDTLPRLLGAGEFDLVFIDADKENGAAYVEWAMRLSRPGAMIIVDNVVRGGEVANPDTDDPRVLGTRRTLALLGSDPRLVSTAVQTVGAKGYDGFSVSVFAGGAG